MALVSSILEKFNFISSSLNNFFRDKLEIKGFPKMKNDRWKYTKTIDIFSSNQERESFDLKANLPISKLGSYDFRYLDDSFAFLSLSLVKDIDFIKMKDEKLILGNSLLKGAYFKALVIEVEGRCNIIEKFTSTEETMFFPLTYIILKRGSSLSYTKLQEHSGSVVDNTLLTLEEGSRLEMVTFSRGSRVLRNNLKVLQKTNSDSTINGIYSVDKGHLDNFLRVEHLDRSRSKQKYKGIVEKGRVSFAGSIFIDRSAPGTESHQLNKTILLDDEGEMNSKPELEILNDDVKCSHGATIGSINEEQLFYLMSRGVTRNEAKLMLINGFLNDLLDKNNREEVLACFKR